MMTAALQVEPSERRERARSRGGPGSPALRCLLMDDNRFDRRVLRRVAEGSRYDIDLVETSGIEETRRALSDSRADLLLLDYRVPDGDGIAFARELSGDARFGGIPVVVITGVGSEQAAIQAIRSGVADYLSKDGLNTEQFDQAIENALRRSAAKSHDRTVRLAELTEENTALRRTALRHMRLLKSQALPLVSFAWRALRGEKVADDPRGETAKQLARITRSVVGLIDETVILSATHRSADAPGPVDLTAVVAAILKDEKGEIATSRARVRVGPLPVLTVRASQMLLLFEELLLTAVRAARLGHPPQIEIGAGADPDGNPIVWFSEKGLRLSARSHATAERFGTLADPVARPNIDPFAWSLCQRIVERNDGQFKIAASEDEGCTVRMRFPRSMLA